MGNFDRITVVSVDGRKDACHAVESIHRTMAELPGSRGLLVAAQSPAKLPQGVEFIRVESFDYFQYSMFMIHCLHHHIRTDFALVVQDDGWALNGNNWRDEWYEYDYIGAPTHVAGLNGQIHVSYSWVGQTNAIQVLNGGFSLRSKRLLAAPTQFGICYKHLPHPLLRNEDIQLCVILRDDLERRGLRFAPPEAALHFSVEYIHPVIHQHLDLTKLFGHHAKTRRLRPNSVVEVGMASDQVHRAFGETQMLALLRQYGYLVIFKP